MAAFTAVAAGIGVASSLASTGMSFGAAGKARKAADKAAKESKRLMDQARENVQQNFFEGLNVPLEAFGAEFEQNQANNQQSIQALQESGDARNLAAGIGKVAANSALTNEKKHKKKKKDIYDLGVTKAQSRENVKQQLVGMDVGQARDESQKEKEALEARAANITQGMSSIGDGVRSAATFGKLYGRDGKLMTPEEQAELDLVIRGLGGNPVTPS